MPPDRCGRCRFSVTVAAECAELFPLPEEVRAWENVRYKSGDVNYNTRHPLYNIGHMFYKTAHPRYKSSDMRYKSSYMFYKSVDMPRIPAISAPVCNDNRSPCEITPDRREAHREPHRSSQRARQTPGLRSGGASYTKSGGRFGCLPCGALARVSCLLNAQKRSVRRSTSSV